MLARTVQGFAIVALCCACDVDGDAAPEASSFRKVNPNGPVINGSQLNGVQLNGVQLNGVQLNGVQLNGVQLNGVQLNGSEFSAYEVGEGEPVYRSGTELIGMRFRVVAGGVDYYMAFNNIYLDPLDADGDRYLYDINVYDSAADSWSPLCTIDGQPAAAIPLKNYWDPQTGDRIDNPEVVTFACEGAVLAKCVRWGYEPWASGTRCDSQGVCDKVSLADYHQACTRMARADYCGDGKAHTVNGTKIDIFDPLSPAIQSRTTAGQANWDIEAEWGPDGAVCVGPSLRLQYLDDLNVGYDDPECLPALMGMPDCGSFAPERGAMVADAFCSLLGTDPASCG